MTCKLSLGVIQDRLNIRISLLPTGDLFVLVFSMDCRESFEEAIRLREAILESKVSATQGAGKGRKSHHHLKVPMVIVGNKCDRETKYVHQFLKKFPSIILSKTLIKSFLFSMKQ